MLLLTGETVVVVVVVVVVGVVIRIGATHIGINKQGLAGRCRFCNTVFLMITATTTGKPYITGS